MESQKNKEIVDRIIPTSVKTLGYLGMACSVALEVKGIWMHDFGMIAKGLVFFAASGNTIGAGFEMAKMQSDVRQVINKSSSTVDLG